MLSLVQGLLTALFGTTSIRSRQVLGFGAGIVVVVVLAFVLTRGEDGHPEKTEGVAASLATPTATDVATQTEPTLQPLVRTTTPTRPAEYTVQSGDSLFAICAELVSELGLDECTTAIVELNGMSDPDQLSLGQVLRLPGGTDSVTAQNDPDNPTPTGEAVATQQPEPQEVTQQPTASATSASPASTPSFSSSPVELRGVGNLITDLIAPPGSTSILSFTYSASDSFTLKTMVGGDESTLANDVGPYSGRHALVVQAPFVLTIEATGAWTVRIDEIGTASTAAFQGSGNDVSGLFDPPAAGPWSFTHDGSRNFSVWLHCAGGSELVQSELGSASLTSDVSFQAGPCFWTVEADGSWSLAPG